MKFSQVFEVGKPVPEVWALFQEVPAVAQCMPGADITADKGNGVYSGRVSMKLGPLSPTFEGEAAIEFDEGSRQIRLSGSGVDRQGGSRGRVDVRVDLREQNGTTSVSLDANVTLSGAAARFGRTGLIEEMASRLIEDFVGCLELKLAAESPTEAAEVRAEQIRGLSLLLESIISWLRRAFGRLLGRSVDR